MKNFITLEGCDGVGKTHQNKKLQQYCFDHDKSNVVFTREPGGSNIAEQIRKVVLDGNNREMTGLCEAFLYAASRVQHLADIVKPALESGKVVLCDRFVHSSYVYQGLGRELGLDKIINLNAIAVGEYMPEFTIFLDLPPAKAFARKGGVDISDRLEDVAFSFHERVYEGYKMLIAQNPDQFVVIDASGSADDTHQLIITALKNKGIL